jgi:hypothetical protein
MADPQLSGHVSFSQKTVPFLMGPILIHGGQSLFIGNIMQKLHAGNAPRPPEESAGNSNISIEIYKGGIPVSSEMNGI